MVTRSKKNSPAKKTPAKKTPTTAARKTAARKPPRRPAAKVALVDAASAANTTGAAAAPARAAAGAPITFALAGVLVDAGAASRGAPPAAGATATSALPAGLRHGTLVHSVRVQAQRSQVGGMVHVQARPGRDVVVLRLANGPELVLHPEHARALMLAQQDARPASRGVPGTHAEDGDDSAIEVPVQLRWRGLEAAASNAAAATRGGALALLGEMLLSGFDVVRDAAGDTLAGISAKVLAQRIDDQVEPGVYPLPRGGPLTKFKGSGVASVAPGKTIPDSARPILVFVHGTFSNTASGFGGLWSEHPQRVEALFKAYDQVWALDHATLSASPVDNALALVRALPNGARVHLVTHSRGGLVAEVLARAAANPSLSGEDLRAFSAEDRAALKQLGDELLARATSIDRVVRVACPARGTLLASGRLDAYLSVFKWTLSLSGVPVMPEIVDFLAAVAERRTDVNTMPGLAAQIPDSALIRWLHASVEPVPGELRVVAGDVKADSPTAWLKTLLTDSFYWTDNDFVVQTSSMYGGVPRTGGASFLLDRGGDVAHTRYFHHARTAEAVCNALTQDAPEGFRPIGPLSWRGEDASGVRARRAARGGAREETRAPSEKPAVILLPGILGSNIAVNGKRIWLGLRLVGGLSRLAYPDLEGSVCSPDGPIGLIYDDLADHLRATHEVIEFAFDWRKPIEDEAQRLAEEVARQLDLRKHNSQPVRFVAHSMGGLVVRTMQIVAPDVWKLALARDGARVLMLGTPNAGSWAPMQVLSGDDTFGNTLVAFGAPFGDRAARQLMAQFPGFIQLQAALVDDQRQLDKEATWKKLAADDLASVRQFNWWHSDERQLNAYEWGVPPQAVLDQAVALRRKLDAQREKDLPGFADKLLLVVGQARFTPDGYEIGQQGLEYLDAQDDGDGRVTRPSARLPGVRTWELDCEHGKLPDAESAFDAYTELLTDGTTSKLKLLPDLAAAGRAERGERGLRGGPAATHVTASQATHVRSRPARRPKVVQPPALESELGTLSSLGDFEVPPPSGLPAIEIEVLNDNLMFTRPPLLVGHYRATRLSGAGAVVDELLDGALAMALRAGIYPERVGTYGVFRNASKGDNPLQLPRPEHAIVVGLGDESNFKASALRDTVRLGLIAWARHQAERSGGAPPHLEIATTLVGSGGTGITPGQSAQMIARAAWEANQVLANCGWPLITRLSFVELYLDRASEAWRALHLLASASKGQWQVADEVERGAGALRRSLDASYRGAEYDLISAVMEGAGISARIAYTLDTRRARSEVRAQLTQPRLLREMVRRNSNARQQDPNIGHTLYQLLVPVEMDAFFGGTTEMRIELDPGTAGIPWELLRHPADDKNSTDGPWAVRTKLLRKLRTSEFRALVRDATRDSGVLVIGEPATPPAPKDKPELGYIRLPGARREACTVQASLAEFFGPGSNLLRALIAADDAATQPDADRIVGALLERDWRVVHIAGHGLPPELAGPEPRNEGDPPQRVVDPRGVVLSNGYLGPSEIRSMRTVPELVFINCCHGAERDSAQLFTQQQQPSSRAEFASTVADELIKIGVRCVVAAGWAVEDGPASEFAREFYAALTAGERFLDASARARKAAWLVRGSGNTWAAYQCYGDPDWRLVRRAPRQVGRSLAERYAGVSSPVALDLALETVAVESSHIRGASAERDRKMQLQRLVWLETHFAKRWGGHGFVAHRFAQCWKALGNDDKAIAWYESATRAQDGSAPQTAIEQQANLRVRQAATRVETAADAHKAAQVSKVAKDAKDAKKAAAAQALTKTALDAAVADARKQIERAIKDLMRLSERAETVELNSLAGSAYKRLATIETNLGNETAAQDAIAKMRYYYEEAVKHARKSASPELFYPGLNLLVAQMSARSGPAKPLDAALVAEIRASIKARVADDPDFWSVAADNELLQIEALSQGKLAEQAGAVMREFADLQRRISTPGDWRSIYDTQRLVLERWSRSAVAAEKRACDEVLQQLQGFASPGGG